MAEDEESSVSARVLSGRGRTRFHAGRSWSAVRGPVMRRHERMAEMLQRARELAGHGHRPQMIEAVLQANGFHEAADFIEQPHITRELREIADRARRRDETERAIREGEPGR